jgi:hypothetical protein
VEGQLSHITPSVYRLSKGRISNILGTVWRVEKKVEENKRCYVYTDNNSTTATTQAKGIKVKLSRNISADI